VTAIVDHARDHDFTVAGKQAACGWALHLIATEKHRITGKPLPRLSWTIRDDSPRLFGMAFANTDEQRAQIVTDWANHLNAVITIATPLEGERRIEFDVIAHGVDVHIQARLSAAKKEAAA
jgi:hypothetical protein